MGNIKKTETVQQTAHVGLRTVNLTLLTESHVGGSQSLPPFTYKLINLFPIPPSCLCGVFRDRFISELKW